MNINKLCVSLLLTAFSTTSFDLVSSAYAQQNVATIAEQARIDGDQAAAKIQEEAKAAAERAAADVSSTAEDIAAEAQINNEQNRLINERRLEKQAEDAE